VSDNPLFEKYGQTIRDGSPIFQEGDVGEKMYIIQSGYIRITKRIDGRDHLLAELGKGDFFGEMAIVSNIKRSATATASGTVEILAFDRPGFEAMISKNTKIAMSVIDKLSQRLQNANAQIQQLLRRNERSMIALNLYNRFMEKQTDEPVLTFDKTVEAIALELQSPQELISEVLYGFDTASICQIEGNGIRLRDKRRLVALATVEDS
jgi:CRP-like cAMP-binding protein